MTKLLKTLHIMLAGICLGGYIAVLILGFLKSTINPATNYRLYDWLLYQLVNVVINYTFYGLIVTTFLYGLLTTWGFFKYRWVILKWVGMTAIFLVYWFWQGPAVNGLAALSDTGRHLSSQQDFYQSLSANLKWSTGVQIILLVILFGISVYKPGGKRKHTTQPRKTWMTLLVSILLLFGLFSLYMQYKSVAQFRNLTINDIDLDTLQDGEYTGELTSYGYTYRVAVTITDHRITNINILDNRTSSYAIYAEGIVDKIIKQQKLNVNAVTGATTTSVCLQKAVANALQQ